MDHVDRDGIGDYGGVLVGYARRTTVGAEHNTVGGRVDATGRGGVRATTRKGGHGDGFVSRGRCRVEG
jgi:hypothetical protein